MGTIREAILGSRIGRFIFEHLGRRKKRAQTKPFKQWAAVHLNEKFMAVTALSGFGRHLPEDINRAIYLEPDATEIMLGRAVLETLDRSRFVDPSDDHFYDIKRILAADRLWHQDMMTRYRYRSRAQAYKMMRYCLADRNEGRISIRPHKRDAKAGLWWDLPAEKTVVIPSTNDPEVAGAAMKLALSHCETF
jgi:hypothetical protein